MTDKEKIKALSETIESQKQTFDALLKKHAAMQESRDELLEALDDVKNCGSGTIARKIAVQAIAKTKGQKTNG